MWTTNLPFKLDAFRKTHAISFALNTGCSHEKHLNSLKTLKVNQKSIWEIPQKSWGFMGVELRDINTSLSRSGKPDLWPVLTTGANTNKQNTKPHSHQLKLHCMPKPLKPTDIIPEALQIICSSLKCHKSVIQSTNKSLRLSGYNQGRAVLFKELVVKRSWEIEFTR